MALYNANLIIRETRKAQGMTQERLAEGICSRETIVKLERGERKPHWFIFRELLRRLGLSPEIYHNDITSGEDLLVFNQLQEWNKLVLQLKYDELKTSIDKIEAAKDTPEGKHWFDGMGYWFLLRIRATFYAGGAMSYAHESKQNKYLDPVMAVKNAFECIKYARPDFETDKIPSYYLAMHEYTIIPVIARSYMLIGKEDEAFGIWRSLKVNFEKNYMANVTYPLGVDHRLYRAIIFEMGQALQKSRRDNEDWLRVAEEGMALSFDGNDLSQFANFTSLKACALHALGRIDESKEFFKREIMFTYLLDGYPRFDFATAKKLHEDTYGEQLDLSFPW